MNVKSIQRSYYILLLLNTLAGAFIWGVNTLFLLDAGLSNAEAFAANAFFTAGMVLFEVPTGVIADTLGRRASYLMGTITLLVTTFLYLLLWQHKFPFWGWAVVSMALGLGFTFFSGAVEAWLVDALNHTGFKGSLEDVFARGQIITGVGMLTGSVAGGYLAQAVDLGAPYLARCVFLGLSLLLAARMMKDIGFTPRPMVNLGAEMRRILRYSISHGIRVRSVRWVMLISPFTMGVGVYIFYAAQPFLLELYGDSTAYGIAGLAAALVAGSQILGGMIVPTVRRLFARRSTYLGFFLTLGILLVFAVGMTQNFWMAIVFLGLWSLVGSATRPVRQAYLNESLPSEQRATILSFDGLVGSLGGVVFQPGLGRAADIWSYSTTFVISAGIQMIALPFVWLMRRENSQADQMH